MIKSTRKVFPAIVSSILVNAIFTKLLPLSRLIAINILQCTFSIGDEGIPNRFTITLNDIKESSNIQYIPESNLAISIAINQFIISSYEVEELAYTNPDLYICNFRISLFVSFMDRRVQFKLLNVNLGDYIHIRFNIGLIRQVHMLLASLEMYSFSLSFVTMLYSVKKQSTSNAPEEDNTLSSPLPSLHSPSISELYLLPSTDSRVQELKQTSRGTIRQFQQLLSYLPLSIKLDLPKIELDIISKENVKKNKNINFVTSCNVAFDV